jgi:hypothetical protein
MATKPALPPGEEPLDAGTIDLLLSNLGSDMVLVGGQALAFWMDRFGIRTQGAAISNDGDALGVAARAAELALSTHARLVLPPKTALPSLVAQLRYPVGHGRERNVDVLHKLYTIGSLRKSSGFTEQVVHNSVEVEWRPGRLFRVMEPIDVLESRAHDAVGLVDDKGPHVVTQAKWAIAVARAAFLKLASDPQAKDRLGAKIQRVYRLAGSSVGKRLWLEHRVDLLDAIDVQRLRGQSVAHGKQLDAIEKAIERRRTSGDT